MASTDRDFAPSLASHQFTEVTRLLGEIDEFKGHWRKLQEIREERLAELRQITTIESTASSTRIEGAELSDEEVARVLQGLHVDSFRARDESEVRGYGELLQIIFDNYAEVPLTENHIKQLHNTLLRHSIKDERHRGEYKKFENHVEARYPDGRTEIIFKTAAPFDTPRLMSELVEQANQLLADRNAHPLIVIARFLVEFLAIHPFQDGNGRLARGLTSLLLLRAGYDYVPYASLERVVEDNKGAYYAALRDSQHAMREDPRAYGEWLVFFLRTLRAQKQGLEAKLSIERSLLKLSNAQQRILDLVTKGGRVTTTAVTGQLGIPRRTVHYHLDVLVSQGLVEAHGEKRGRYYTRPTGTARQGPTTQSITSAILAEVLENGGSIGASALRSLVIKHGYDPRTVGTLHGRRESHLRRDPKTGMSTLTARGEEVAKQHLFTARLSGAASVPDSEQKTP